ncbi:MAG: hypothetical protein ACYTGP_11945 [Planctomycetota bacterium]|jgi:hypothetical protein
MQVRSIRLGTVMVLAVVLSSLAGCGGSPPSAGVSDFGVYTTLHLQAVHRADVQGRPAGFSVYLDRYFGSRPEVYEATKTRMDMMLDGMQRSSGYAQAIRTYLALHADVTLRGDAAGADEDAADDAGDDTNDDATIPDDIRKRIDDALAAQVVDSPFDQLDRVSDFYAAYIMKFLRLSGDSRTLDPDILARALAPMLTDAGIEPPLHAYWADGRPSGTMTGVPPSHRLIVLYVQVHVEPGTGANNMVGLRLQITDAEGAAPEDVRVVRLHPTRNYDVDSVAFAEDLSQSLRLALHATAPSQAGDATVDADRGASLEAAERRRFLSRIGKTGSFASATERTFGWNFYPSNLEVVKPNALEAIGGWLFGTPRAYNVRGTLEAGGRDCMAVLVVPTGLESFTCEASYVHAALNPDGVPGKPKPEPITGTMTVELPPYHPMETVLASLAPASATPLLQSEDERRRVGHEDDEGRRRIEIPDR